MLLNPLHANILELYNGYSFYILLISIRDISALILKSFNTISLSSIYGLISYPRNCEPNIRCQFNYENEFLISSKK